MTPAQIEIVQQTWKLVQPFQENVTELFYGRLFALDPAVKPLFAKTNMADQKRKLMASLTLAVNSLNRLDQLVPVLRDMGRRHVGYGVKESDYQTVGAALLWTLEKGLGSAFTPQVKEAWATAYNIMATTMIEAAREMPPASGVSTPEKQGAIPHPTGSIMAVCLGIFIAAVSSQAETIRGRVVLEGTLPAPEKIVVVSDTSVCGTHQPVAKVLVGEGGGIANAVVRLVGQFPAPKAGEAKLDQIKCQFEPHVIVLPVGSKLVITSSDEVLHNAHGFDESGSDIFNIAVPIKGMKVPVMLKKPSRIKLRCDAGHTWMSGYIIVAEHSYYAVTDKNGGFELKDVPAGNHTLEVWHETLGKQEQKIEAKTGDADEVKFTYKGGDLK